MAGSLSITGNMPGGRPAGWRFWAGFVVCDVSVEAKAWGGNADEWLSRLTRNCLRCG
jgi:hypothetical protein